MIPFSILNGKYYKAEKCLGDFNVLELAPDYFTLRVGSDSTELMQSADLIVLSFYDYDSQGYKTVALSSFETSVVEKGRYASAIKVLPDNPEYVIQAKKLSRLYLSYVDAKLNLSEEELSCKFSNYPADEDSIFEKDYDSAVTGFLRKITDKYDRKAWENTHAARMQLFLAVEDIISAKHLCELGTDEYAADRLGGLCKLKHPLFNGPFSGVILGNSYCYNLLIPTDLVEKVYIMLQKQGKEVYITLAPCPESCLGAYTDYISRILERIPEIAGFIVNDMGIFDFIRSSYPEVYVEKGVLLHKAYRDPRSKYLFSENVTEPMTSDTAVYAPFYQINTSTFCTLHPLALGYDRGKNCRLSRCGHECETVNILYPSHLDTVGKYNSIFGFGAEFFSHPQMLTDFASRGFERLVINL